MPNDRPLRGPNTASWYVQHPRFRSLPASILPDTLFPSLYTASFLPNYAAWQQNLNETNEVIAASEGERKSVQVEIASRTVTHRTLQSPRRQRKHKSQSCPIAHGPSPQLSVISANSGESPASTGLLRCQGPSFRERNPLAPSFAEVRSVNLWPIWCSSRNAHLGPFRQPDI